MKVGLTYSDVLLVPKRTSLQSRSEATLHTKFTKNILLNAPLVSANMATVTEHKMAIAMAMQGGLGIVHQFCTIEEQVEQVRLVKRVTGYVVEQPLSIAPDASLFDAIYLMEKNDTSSLIVVDNSKVVGILTHKDYQFVDDKDALVQDLMTGRKKLVTAQPGVSIDDAKQLMSDHRVEKIILLDDNDKLRGIITAKDILTLQNETKAVRDKKGRLLVGAALGVKDTIQRAEALIAVGVDVLVLDVAHGHADNVIACLKELKKKFSIDVMVGNIATAQAAQDLIEAGADGLKVGIGPSPVCTTRIMSGAGVPQLTAVMDVCAVANKYDVPVTADGGAKYPGDCVKALAAGASTVFSGSFFAGTDEAPGLVIRKDGKQYKRYAGSAAYVSNHEKKERIEGKRVKERLDIFVEGVSTLVDYKGPVKQVIDSYCKGIASGLSYCGAKTIQEAKQNSEFIQITAAGWQESLSRGNKLSE